MAENDQASTSANRKRERSTSRSIDDNDVPLPAPPDKKAASSHISDSETRSSSHTLKRSRKNTRDEKRRMRQKRKKERRREKTEKKKQQEKIMQESLLKVSTYRGMARSFWERWQWELMKRREAMKNELMANGQTTRETVHVPEIDPMSLHDPASCDGEQTEVYIGRGAFSIVRLQLYRGMKVAVKEFLPKSVSEDVQNEAKVLSILTHPYLPFLFGMCTKSRPHRLVMQFHGIELEPITLLKELHEHTLGEIGPMAWLILCVQILEAIEYVHDHQILHNDIKCDNILLTSDSDHEMGGAWIHGPSVDSEKRIHIILIDFGKATHVSESRRYTLSESEKIEYIMQYPHIAPEVVYGETKQSYHSDMYSVGKLFQKMADSDCFQMLPNETRREIQTITDRLKHQDWHKRYLSKRALELISEL